MNKRKKLIISIVSFICVLTVLFVFCAVYVNDYYPADLGAAEVFKTSSKITSKMLDDGTVIYAPENPKAGLIFYPGGKVEYTAYIPLMQACASKGILCALVEMPFNLAVLDINAADGIREQYTEITDWYIGGHSLGGSMAASYLAENSGSFSGLVLLGAYSTADLSNLEVEVLSVFGSEDKVMNREKYDENLVHLPEEFEEHIIDGGCHAYFGMYGEQEGDGTPTVTNEEQIEKTSQIIKNFVKK